MLKVDGLNQYYGGSHILRNVAFEAALGEVTVVLGRNGVGKTTLLKSLMGIVPVATGSIRLDGRDLTHEPPYARVRAGIGYVPQGREIFGRLTVEENLRMGLAHKSAATPIPGELFELFPVLRQMLHRRGGDLSGGQQQQLAIARALAAGPKLLLLDEPTEGIQPSIVAEIGAALGRIRAELGVTLVVVEQVIAFAWRLCEGFVALESGRQALAGRTDPETSEQVLSVLRI
jgi:urea transport system ATP-binding protein